MGQIFSRISLIMLVPLLYLERPNSAGIDGDWRGVVFLVVSHAHTARGRWPSAPQFWGTLQHLFMHPDAELLNFAVATPLERRLVLGISHAHAPKGDRPSAPQFWGLYGYS